MSEEMSWYVLLNSFKALDTSSDNALPTPITCRDIRPGDSWVTFAALLSPSGVRLGILCSFFHSSFGLFKTSGEWSDLLVLSWLFY